MRIKIQIVIALLLWCYIIYRALFISITQDEAYTYLLVKTYKWKLALTTTNTHWLNSLFIRLLLYLPGQDHLWKIRMLPMLCWIVYSYSTIRLSSYFKSQWIGFVFFIIAILNPFLIFYFSLARGYAPACAFIMLSLWLALKNIQTNEIRPQKWFNVFLAASVATLANFSAFYFFLGLVSIFLIQLLVNKRLDLLCHSSAKRWFLLVAGILIVSIGALFLIKIINKIWFPGNTNLVNSLFGSLIRSTSYFDNDPIAYYKEGVSYLLNEEIPVLYKGIGILIGLVFTAAFFYSSFFFLKSKKITLTFLSLFSCMVIILINVFLHFVFRTPYLFDRATLIFYPPLVLGLCCFIDIVIENSLWINRLISVLLSFVVIIFGYNYYKSFSLNNFPDWPVQINTKECLDYLKNSKPKMVGMNGWHYSVFLHYYSTAYPGKYIFNYQIISKEAQLDSLNTSLLSKYDYLLLAPPYKDSAILKNWDIKLSFPESGTKVLKNNSVR